MVLVLFGQAYKLAPYCMQLDRLCGHFPYDGTLGHFELFSHLVKSNFLEKLESEAWSRLSNNAKALLAGLLEPIAEQRLTCLEIYESQWMTSSVQPAEVSVAQQQSHQDPRKALVVTEEEFLKAEYAWEKERDLLLQQINDIQSSLELKRLEEQSAMLDELNKIKVQNQQALESMQQSVLRLQVNTKDIEAITTHKVSALFQAEITALKNTQDLQRAQIQMLAEHISQKIGPVNGLN